MIRPAGGAAEWVLIVTLLIPLVAILAVAIYLTRRIIMTGLSWQDPGPTVALVICAVIVAGVLRIILAASWKLFGREDVIASQQKLTLRRVFGPVRWRRHFSLAEVSNIRWREHRVAAKGGTYFRKVVSFDAGKRTVDLGTQLSFADAHDLERELRSVIDDLRR